ncbi:MAG: sugar phosphate isomerase/epimerase [Spirochaetes bacterium]|nr:sugar phosphate isomerase/epimerase [Spirochaetota bacterium]
MNFGAHCYLFTDRWSDKELPLLDRARALGLTMFEIAVGDDVHFDYRRTADRAKALGLDLIVSPGGVWPSACDLSSDNADERKLGLAWHTRQIDIAAELGAQAYAGALYGHPGTVKRRRPPDEEYHRIAEGLHALAEYAHRAGVVLALEPMSHFRTHLVNTPEQVMRLISLADHAGIFALLDTYHMVTEIRDFAAAIRTLAPRLYALHACENDRGVPGGGLIPWQTIFQTLHEVGFDGYIGLEAYNSSIGDFAYEHGMFHDVCPDGAAFITQGMKYLRSVQLQK